LSTISIENRSLCDDVPSDDFVDPDADADDINVGDFNGIGHRFDAK
jgi:hypothetical protein